MIRGLALSIRASNMRLVHHTPQTAYIISIAASDLHLELVEHGSASGSWRLTTRDRDGGREVNTTGQLASSLSAVLRVAVAENAGTVTVRLLDCPSSVVVFPQHQWPCFHLEASQTEARGSFESIHLGELRGSRR